MNQLLGVLFALACFLTAFTSSALLGIGMWFWVILATGLGVCATQFVQALSPLGGLAAALLAFISALAVMATIAVSFLGGSFEMDGGTALLAFGFSLIALFGFLLIAVHWKRLRGAPYPI